MKIVQGLWQRDGFDAGEIADILGNEIDSLFWLIDVQSGVLQFAGLETLGNPDELWDRYVFSPARLTNTSTYALRPGALTTFKGAFNWDEQSYLVGFRAREDEVESLVASMPQGSLRDEFWNIFEKCGEIFVEDIDDGMAFTWTTRPEWFEKLAAANPQAKPITLEGV